MRKIYLVLAIFALAGGLFVGIMMVPNSWTAAQSTPTPTEEPQEETGPVASPLTTTAATTGSQATTATAGMASVGAMSGTEAMSGTQNMSGTEGMSATIPITFPLFATAQIQDVDGNMIGAASFSEDAQSHIVTLSVAITGMKNITPGEHGIHIHQVGLCTPDFAAAGEHFNPNMAQHGLMNPKGPHNGDLPNIVIDAQGNATTYTVTSHLFTLSAGPDSILAADGSALVIHAKPDDEMTDPSGMSDGRIACGVVTAAGVPTLAQPTPPPPTENATVLPALCTATPARIAQLQVPAGFTVTVFAKDLANIRMMAQDSNGLIYVTRPAQNDVIALTDADSNGVADGPPVKAATDLTEVHGILITGTTVYLATPTSIYRGDIVGDGTFSNLQEIVNNLPDGAQHPRRTIALGPDGMLYITIGSSCNECGDTNPYRASILRMNPDGSNPTVFVRGLRNTMGFGWQPQTQEMWGMDQGSDGHGNDNPAEELNKIEQGNNYGWPFCYNNKEVDRYLAVNPKGLTKAEFCDQSTAPAILYQAHSSPIGMIFYTGTQFPQEYQNSAFVAMRGSWNREQPTGYKVVHLAFDQNGQPVQFEDFLTGFLIEGGNAQFGRPAGLLVAQDGSLLLTDDTNGILYRISYQAPGQ